MNGTNGANSANGTNAAANARPMPARHCRKSSESRKSTFKGFGMRGVASRMPLSQELPHFAGPIQTVFTLVNSRIPNSLREGLHNTRRSVS